MLTYAFMRLLYVVPVALGVSIVCFALVHLAPGDPLVSVLPPDASAQLQAEMRAIYGFDRPWPVQFAMWLWGGGVRAPRQPVVRGGPGGGGGIGAGGQHV